MAEIDGLDSFVRATRAVLEEFPAPTIVLPRAAVEAFVAAAEASLRAPKGELEEARAELGAWLVSNPYTSHSGPCGHISSNLRAFDDPQTPVGLVSVSLFRQGNRIALGLGRDEAAAIRAALSRARGEGT